MGRLQTLTSALNEPDEKLTDWVPHSYQLLVDEVCLCGQPHIKHCHSIRNKKTGELAFPIGSSCIRRFMRDKLEIAKNNEKAWKKQNITPCAVHGCKSKCSDTICQECAPRVAECADFIVNRASRQKLGDIIQDQSFTQWLLNRHYYFNWGSISETRYHVARYNRAYVHLNTARTV